MKLVDTKDLKSLPFWECQFESGRGHQLKMNKPSIVADNNLKSLSIKKKIAKVLKKNNLKIVNLNIVIGGDGFMLKTLKQKKNNKHRVFYGVNSGNYGFLMNKFSLSHFSQNILKSKMISISPLEMLVKNKKGFKKYIAINEVSILRQNRQAANLSVIKNSKYIIKKLVSDGVLISTPAGSTAYNLSVNGPILNLNSKKISIAPISAFRPRRWSGKIVSDESKIIIYNLDPQKRPVSAVADNQECRNVKKIIIKINKNIKFNLLYDKNASLHKKIKLEQLRKET